MVQDIPSDVTPQNVAGCVVRVLTAHGFELPPLPTYPPPAVPQHTRSSNLVSRSSRSSIRRNPMTYPPQPPLPVCLPPVSPCATSPIRPGDVIPSNGSNVRFLSRRVYADYWCLQLLDRSVAVVLILLPLPRYGVVICRLRITGLRLRLNCTRRQLVRAKSATIARTRWWRRYCLQVALRSRV